MIAPAEKKEAAPKLDVVGTIESRQIVQPSPMQSKFDRVTCVDFNWSKFDAECREIIGDVRGRLMDLAQENIIDDENYDYIDQMQEKQDKFNAEFASRVQHDFKDWLSEPLLKSEQPVSAML